MSSLRPEQLPAALERSLAPVYLLGGNEPLLLQECRDAIIRAAQAQGFTEREVIETNARFDWAALRETSAAPSLFAQRRIIDLRLPTGKPGVAGGRTLQEWAETPDPDILLIVSCESWDAASRKAKWAMALDRAGLVPPITNRDEGVVLNHGPFPSDIFIRNIPEYVSSPLPNLLPYDEKAARALAESTIMFPDGSVIGKPAPMAAAIGSSTK